MRNFRPMDLIKIRNAMTDIAGETRRVMDLLEELDSGDAPETAKSQGVDWETAIREAASKHPSLQDNGAGQTIAQAMASIDNGAGTKELIGLGLTPDGIPRRDLPWGKRVSTMFLDKVLWIERDLGLNANHLMNCMAFETGRSFSPKVKNPGSSATGLIQFMESTAKRLGTTTAQLATMTAENQLNYVWKYFEDYAGRMDLKKWNLGDTYMAILWPAGIGKPDSHPIFVQGKGNTYAVNRGLDANRDGTVTRGECINKILQMQAEGSALANYGYGSL